jgi:Brp/Blh family beta-carotene 15,15'-monooxygenase
MELKPSSINSIKFFLKGSLVISLPLFCKFDETLEIFRSLYIKNDIFFNLLISFDNKNIFLYLVLIGFLSNFVISKNNKITLISESFVLFLLNLSTAPLVAFTIYFCFLHSIRHSISLAHELNKKDFKAGLKDFLNKILPLTILTAIAFIICLFVLQKYYSFNDAILKVIFIGLASLTFPHILLEYLIEKNEK